MRKTATALSEAARDALAASTITDDGLGCKLPGIPGTPTAPPRSVYEEANEALVRAGFKWNRRAGSHTLVDAGRAGRALDVLSEIIGTGVAPARNVECWYATPPELALRVAKACVAWLRLNAVSAGTPVRVLEPSVGEGALLIGLADHLDAIGDASASHMDVTGVEIDEYRGHVAFKALTGRFHNWQMYCADFLGWSSERYDLVLMNPPFDSGAAVRHILHAWDVLNPGGRLVAIAPAMAHLASTGQDKLLARLIVSHGKWEPNPDGSFVDAGTSVRTITVILDKPNP